MPVDAGFEKSFSDIAFAYYSQNFPKLFQFVQGFQLLDVSDDEDRAFGVFGFRLGNDMWCYAPVFLIKGTLKGQDLLYNAQSDTLLPLDDVVVDSLIQRRPILPGDASVLPRGKIDQYAPDYSRILDTARMKYASIRKLASGSKLIHAEAIVARLVVDPSEIKKFASINLDLERLSRDIPTFRRKLAEAVKYSGVFSSALGKFYPNLLDSARADNAPVDYSPKTDPIREALQASDEARSKEYLAKQAAKEKNNEDVVFLSRSDKDIESLPLTNDIRQDLAVNGLAVVDARDQKSEVLPAISALKATRVDKSGTYDLIIGDRVERLAVVRTSEGELSDCCSSCDSTYAYSPRSAPHRRYAVGRILPSRDGNPVFVSVGEYADNELLAVADSFVPLQPNHFVRAGKLFGESYDYPGYGCVDSSTLLATDGADVRMLRRFNISSRGSNSFIVTPYRSLRIADALNKELGDDPSPIGAQPISIGELATLETSLPANTPVCFFKQIYSGSMNPRLTAYMKDPQALRNLQTLAGLLRTTRGNAQDMLVVPNTLDALVPMEISAPDHSSFEIRVNGETRKVAGRMDGLKMLVYDLGIHGPTAQRLLKRASARRPVQCMVKLAAPYIPDGLAATVPSLPDAPRVVDQMNGVPVEVDESLHSRVQGMPQLTDKDYGEFDPDLGKTFQFSEETEDKDTFDASVLLALARSTDLDASLQDYMRDIGLAVDRLGRILFLMYYHMADFNERYGDTRVSELESTVKNAFRTMGRLMVFLQQTTSDKSFDGTNQSTILKSEE